MQYEVNNRINEIESNLGSNPEDNTKNNLEIQFIPEVDIVELSESLREHHALFAAFWEIDGKITFSKYINTAAIKFYEGEPIEFIFNPQYWLSIDSYLRDFIICHEMLHIFYNHGSRSQYMTETIVINGEKISIANIAADLIVNHSLIDNFNFDRELLTNSEDYIWVDTILKNGSLNFSNRNPDTKANTNNSNTNPETNLEANLETSRSNSSSKNSLLTLSFNSTENNLPLNLSFEEYYELLVKLKNEIDETKQLVDEHSLDNSFEEESRNGGNNESNNNDSGEEKDSEKENEEKNPLSKPFFDSSQSKNINKEIEDLINRQDLTIEDIEDFNIKSIGNSSINIVRKIEENLSVVKKSWEEFFSTYIKENREEPEYIEQWVRKDRRMSFLGNELLLPSEEEIEKEEPKFNISLFLDVSRSCIHLSKDFWKAANSIPKDSFNIKAYTFTTETYPCDLKSKELRGYGGTCFQCIENTLQKEVNSGISYPEIVLVITDGEAKLPRLEKPENWYFFLSQDYTKGIPKESKVHLLENIK